MSPSLLHHRSDRFSLFLRTQHLPAGQELALTARAGRPRPDVVTHTKASSVNIQEQNQNEDGLDLVLTKWTMYSLGSNSGKSHRGGRGSPSCVLLPPKPETWAQWRQKRQGSHLLRLRDSARRSSYRFGRASLYSGPAGRYPWITHTDGKNQNFMFYLELYLNKVKTEVWHLKVCFRRVFCGLLRSD